jgi:TetR/AcrR family transcriptional repressor of nem operon
MLSAKKAQKQRTHVDILSSAAHLLRMRGIVGTSILDVMKRTGLTVGGFYAHFRSKDDLIEDVLRLTLAELRSSLMAGLDDKTSAQRIETMLKRYLSTDHRDNPGTGCPLPSVAGEIATGAAPHREYLAEALSGWADDIARDAPSVRHISSRQVSLAMIALMFGGLCLARAVRDTPLSDEILRACKALGKLPLGAA